MRADLLRAAAGRPVMATPIMRDDERTAMIAPTMVRNGAPTRPTARVAPPPRRKNNAWVAVALTLLGVLAVAALGIGLYVANHNKPQVPVPDLKGQTSDEASRLLNQAKLKPSPTQFNDPNCQQNTVTDQTPAANTKVDEGTTVSYKICLGPGQTSVPQLIGLNRQAAEQALAANNLVGKFTDVNSDQPAGTVVDSDPKPGTPVKQNSTVNVSVSKGNQKKVPPVVGKTEADAKAAIIAAGFKVNEVSQETTDSTQIGKVVNQDPDGGTVADPAKTTVTIFVGKSVAPTSHPTTPNPTASATSSSGTGG
jgi:serine/threonine-protein kinase